MSTSEIRNRRARHGRGGPRRPSLGSRASAAVGLALLVLPAFPQAYAAGGPARTTTVTTSQDELVIDGDCSLREAVVAVNTGARYDECRANATVITVPAGLYEFAIPSAANEDNASSGDLDVKQPVLIKGAGAFETIIDANRVDRAFDLWSGGVVVSRLSIRSGRARDSAGGGIRSAGEGNVVARVKLVQNRAVGQAAMGGAIANLGSLEVRNSIIDFNDAARGGGLFNDEDAYLVVVRSTINHNDASDAYGGGGVFTLGDAVLENVTLVHNRSAAGAGGAISNFAGDGNDSNLTVTHATVFKNSPGNIYWAGAGSINNSIVASGLEGPNCTFEPGALARTNGANLDTDSTCFGGEGIQGAPMLGRLADNGGAVPTKGLASASPAVDAARRPCVATDARGVPRPAPCGSSAGDAGAAPDLGAYELVRCRGRRVDVVGTPRADIVSGTRETDVFLLLGGRDEALGRPGDDVACGGAGADELKGGPGRDVLFGQRGDDLLVGGPDADVCRGGPGADTRRACEAPARDRR